MKKTDTKRYVIIGIVAAIILAVVIGVIGIFSNLHTCDECQRKYVGKEYYARGIFDDYRLCKDCYDVFYDFDW